MQHMKRTHPLCAIILCALATAQIQVQAQTREAFPESAEPAPVQLSPPAADGSEAPARSTTSGFPAIVNKPFIVFNEGVTGAWVTRVITQSGRSNFVFRDFLGGAFLTLETKNMEPLDSMVRLSVYYPLSYSFNKHPQVSKNMFNFAFDLFAAPVFQLNMWNFVRFNLAPGLHFLYQMGDRWNYIDLGIGGMAGVEMPIARRWTLKINGYLSFDYGNFGTNRDMEPYDYVWQYQLDLGIRYSKKAPNRYSYIPSKRTDADDLADQLLKEREKQAKKEAKAASKAEKSN